MRFRLPALRPIEESVLTYLRDSGMEVAVHDWNHDGKLFASKALFDSRIDAINGAIGAWQAKGFRAGMAYHDDEWLQQLKCLYDTSYYDTYPYQMLGGGCRRIWPYRLGHLVELPYTMPQDHVLFVQDAQVNLSLIPSRGTSNTDRTNAFARASIWLAVLNRAEETTRRAAANTKDGYTLIGVSIWKMKAQWLFEQCGMVLMSTHPDYLCHPRLQSGGPGAPRRRRPQGWLIENDTDVQEVRAKDVIGSQWQGSLLEQYAAFLNWFSRRYDTLYWHCLPMEIADWFLKAYSR